MNTVHLAGATSKIVTITAYTASTGLPYTAGAFNTATIAATYTRDGATATTITLVTATAGTWTTSGFVHRGKGVYELGLPNAALAAGVDGVEIAIDGISGVVFPPVRVEIAGVDPRSAAAPDVNVASIDTDAISAAALSAAAVTEIQSGLATAAALTTVDDFLDTEVAAIKAKTDQLIFTKANELDVNIQSINGATITGDGSGTPFDA
jgi:hypothetical protein